ncbi:MAG: response regulator, partial [Calditrichaeota bacterium]|nr:response regulator [Calditrichota bacterium]MCB0317087.1 response regulator [Calditrichota bacterium]
MNTRTTGGEGVILIVDDNATNLGVLFDYLKNATFRVLVAQHGKAALELLQEARPDLILLDVLMPEMDGFETCKHLKENPATRDIPVIFMTALTETVDKVRGFELGAVDYVTKPLQHEEVLARVNTHLTLGRLKQHLIRKNEELAAVNRNLAHLVQEKTRQLVQQEKTATIGRMIQGIVHNMKT